MTTRMSDDPAGQADGDLFRHTFRRFPSGVAIATVATPEGPVGLTLSSVASVSADPPVLSFSVATHGRSAAAVLGAETIAVHLLPASAVALADAFARSSGERFTPSQRWGTSPSGVLRPQIATATLVGSVRAIVPAGSASLIVLDIGHIELGEDAAPLIHHDRRFHGLGPEVTPTV